MSVLSWTRRAVVIAMLAVVAGGSMVLSAARGRQVTGPRDRPPRTAEGDSSIAGRVVDVATNAPIPRAQVQALGDDRVVDAITDDLGRFQLAGLSAGPWRVTVSKSGYFTTQVGQRHPFESPPRITLTPRQRLMADVALSRGGVIAGRIQDETGEPLAGLRVRVYRARMAAGHRRLDAVGAADFTDDTGAYRIYGLPPGDYFVGASLRVAPADSVVETTYAPTYYPGTGDLASAQRIRIASGIEATAVFSLLPVRNVRITGTVATSAGAPASALLTLTSGAAELGSLGVGAATREDGSFTLPDVAPGRYTLSAVLRGDGPAEHGALTMTVGAEDVSGIALVTGPAARLRVRVASDTGASGALPSGVSVTAAGVRAGVAVLSHGSGRAFELGDLVEPFRLRVAGLGESWAVKSVAVDGVDVTDGIVGLSAGQVGDARVVLTDRITLVSGTVTASGAPVKASVILFPNDAGKWAYPSRFVRVAETDERGRFRVAGLPPGETYLAAATDYVEDGEEHDPEFLQRLREAALEFSLVDAEKRALDLTVRER